MSLLTLLKPKESGFVPSVGTYAAPNAPRLIVEVDWDNDPSTVNRIWTDITEFVRDIGYQRSGRQHELQRTEAGTLTALLDNRDGRFDPTYTGVTSSDYGEGDYGDGAYGGGGSAVSYNVKRGRWIRVRAVWNNLIYPRWQGLIENYDVEWPSVGKDSTCTVTASGMFKILNQFDLNGLALAEADTGNRVATIGGLVGIGATWDIGISTVPYVEFTSPTSALSHLQQVEETENGLLYETEDGRINFESRHHRLANSGASVGTIGDDTGEIPYREPVRLEYDDSNITNAWTVTPDGGIEATAEDATSIATHFKRGQSRSILSTSQSEAQSAAEYLVGKYKDPPARVSTVEIIGQADTTTWPTILALVNSNRVLWRRRPSTEVAARTIERECFIEQVSEQITPGSHWRTTLQLSPADTEAGWLLGVSQLGLDTALLY